MRTGLDEGRRDAAPHTLAATGDKDDLAAQVDAHRHVPYGDRRSDGHSESHGMGISRAVDGGIAEIVVDVPPVNALTVAGWFELANHLRAAGDDSDVRAVVLRAEGKGFNAGVDIKEGQSTEGFDALVGANRGCYAAFAAVYECAVPVVAAVHGFCLGGGIGLVGNADVIVASDDATFGLPEVK